MTSCRPSRSSRRAGRARWKPDGFTLTGEGAGRISHTRVWLEDGAIKGFTLIWPTGDEDRRTRLLQEMEQSFARLPGTLEPIVTPEGAQRLDLVSGLEMRRPERARSGFFVDATARC